MRTVPAYAQPLFRIRTAALLALFLFAAPAAARADFQKTKIAVLDFSQQGRELTKDMGRIAAEWLITGLVETGRFDVVERRLLEKIMEEHKLGMTGVVDANSVAQLGKILGVKTIVSGTILSFDDMVEINARLINVETASIIAAEKVKASSATRLNELISQIVDKIVAAFPLEGYVVLRTGDKVTLDLGAKIGVKCGMKFVAFKEGRVIKHPKTGEVLDVEIIEIGEIEITDAREKTCTGVVVKEVRENAVEYGTMVRSSVKGQLVNLQEEEETPREPKKQQKNPAENGSKAKSKVTVPAPSF
jgi:TolB-like protein